jgi:hypothetical protein
MLNKMISAAITGNTSRIREAMQPSPWANRRLAIC